jgi:asparagine synthetase B (glutamine-hydrolysing)
MRESVRLRLISEVPLGAFLSGGVDSSAVVALMAGLSDEPVNTCSIAFEDLQFNESEFAQMVAALPHQPPCRNGQVRRLRPHRHVGSALR